MNILKRGKGKLYILLDIQVSLELELCRIFSDYLFNENGPHVLIHGESVT